MFTSFTTSMAKYENAQNEFVAAYDKWAAAGQKYCPLFDAMVKAREHLENLRVACFESIGRPEKGE